MVNGDTLAFLVGGNSDRVLATGPILPSLHGWGCPIGCPDYVQSSARSGGLVRAAVFLGSRASLPADGARSAAFASLPRAGCPRSHGTTTLGSYFAAGNTGGTAARISVSHTGRGLRRATSVQTPIAVRAKLQPGRHAPLRGRPLCPRQTLYTILRNHAARVVPCSSARRPRRGGNSQEGGPRPCEAAGPG